MSEKFHQSCPQLSSHLAKKSVMRWLCKFGWDGNGVALAKPEPNSIRPEFYIEKLESFEKNLNLNRLKKKLA